MQSKIEKSIKQWTAVFLAIIAYYIVHEGAHLLFALLFGVFEKIHQVF